MLLHQGRLAEAEEYHERALLLARRVGPTYYLPIFLYIHGWIALRQHRLDAAAQLLDESIAVARHIGDEMALVIALPLRGTVSILRNDHSQAWAYLREAERISEVLPGRGMIMTRIALGQLALLQGDSDTAVRQFRTALVAAARGDASSAVCLLAGVDQVRGSIDQLRPPDDQRRIDAALTALRESLGDATYERARLEGGHLSLDDAIIYGRRLSESGTGGPGREVAGTPVQPNP
jgi:tetratricopeptide (TPR) repeat protein